jgi:hypothetical protein
LAPRPVYGAVQVAKIAGRGGVFSRGISFFGAPHAPEQTLVVSTYPTIRFLEPSNLVITIYPLSSHILTSL